MKDSTLSTEEALLAYKALSFFQTNQQIHWQDKRALILDYVHYFVSRDISRDPTASISARNQASVDKRTAQENIVRYFERLYDINSSRQLNYLFGKGEWEHVIINNKHLTFSNKPTKRTMNER